jgi:bifunctional DNA-binding transcriptional regulator/antitoxin component of YhaV-PrlF toxin-antitoxin module
MANLVCRTQVSREGKLSLPAAQRRAAGIAPGSAVQIRQEGNSLIITSLDTVIDELQAKVRGWLHADSVDAFLHDKRIEARRELAEE